MKEEPKIEVCRLTCHLLRYSLIWPSRNEVFNPSKWFYIKQLLFIIFSFIPNMTLLFTHLILSIQVGGIDVSEDLAIISSFLALVIMMGIYVIKQNELAFLLLDLSDFRVYGKPPRFNELNRKLEYFARFICVYASFGAVVYNTPRIINISNCRKMRNIRETCGVFIPYWTPFNADDWYILSLVMTYVFLLVLTIDRGTLFISLQVFEIACNFQLRIDQLNSMILHSFDDPKFGRERLSECIRYHKKLIEYGIRFNTCFIYEMFIFLVMAATICACLENEILEQHDIGGMIHIGGWIGSLFFVCLSGQTLIDASTSIGNAAYNSKWYSADTRLRKDLILIIMRSQTPLFLKTGPFNILSFSLFVSTMKMSYSILALLR